MQIMHSTHTSHLGQGKVRCWLFCTRIRVEPSLRGVLRKPLSNVFLWDELYLPQIHIFKSISLVSQEQLHLKIGPFKRQWRQMRPMEVSLEEDTKARKQTPCRRHRDKVTVYKAGQEATEKSDLIILWSWTFNLHNCEKIHYFCWSHRVCDTWFWIAQENKYANIVRTKHLSSDFLLCLCLSYFLPYSSIMYISTYYIFLLRPWNLCA